MQALLRAFHRTKSSHVWIGGHFQHRLTARHHKECKQEKGVDPYRGGRNEQNRSRCAYRQSHQNSTLVSDPLHDPARRQCRQEVPAEDPETRQHKPNQRGRKGGDIDMALYWDGRAWAFIDDNNGDFKYYSPAPKVGVGLTWVQKIKNSSELGYDFVNTTLSKEAQSCFGSAVRYEHLDEHSADHAPLTEVLAAVS